MLVVVAVFAPLIFSAYWVSALLTQMLFLGVVAASLIFLSAYGGMVSLAQTAIYGVAGFALGNLTTNGNTKGLNLGWAEFPGIVVALIVALAVAFVFGALASRSYGIYFLMITLVLAVIANLFFGQVTSVSGFGGISGIPIPDFLSRTAHPDRLYFVDARRGAARLRDLALRRAHAVRPDACRASATTRCACARSATTSRCTACWRSRSPA